MQYTCICDFDTSLLLAVVHLFIVANVESKYNSYPGSNTYALREPPPLAWPSILVIITAPTATLCLNAWA